MQAAGVAAGCASASAWCKGLRTAAADHTALTHERVSASQRHGLHQPTGDNTRAVAGAASLAASTLVARRRTKGRASITGRRAEPGGVDYAIIRFRIPGFDDLSMLPRVMSALGITLIAANRFFFPDSSGGAEARILTEGLAFLLAAGCWVLPWMSDRLDEAVRRQVSSRPAAEQVGCLPTLAIEASLDAQAKMELAWTTGALLRLTSADGLAVWKGDANGGSVVCTRGLLRQLPGFSKGQQAVLATLTKSWTPRGASAATDGYCATRDGLESFPAQAVPKSVLPPDAEAVIVKPIACGGVLVLWSTLPRAFDRALDRQWVAQAASKIGTSLLEGSAATAAAPEAASKEICYESSLPFLGDDDEEAESRDPFARYESEIRLIPGAIGMAGLFTLAASRIALISQVQNLVRGVDPAQSRADLIAGTMAITLVLQTAIWLSETPKDPEIEDVSTWQGVEKVLGCSPDVEESSVAATDLLWAWNTLSKCTRTCSMAVFWKGTCVMQGGLFRRSDAGGVAPVLGPLCNEVMTTGKGRYLASLKNYPAKEQFLPFFPLKTQGLLLTPLRPSPSAPAEGVLVLGVDTMRGLGRIDQAWISTIAEKVAVSLAA
eukprot:TRINITY_DN27647_c0_g2_i1.p1 TRINITY_DN27647_c0_g2~~TRINITY_DN27647_c0_g2_i1.p1  ORF type:complete len:606 (+),score=113.97 TRINITY_DN27647_c0_g2_i1:68-1885(+)